MEPDSAATISSSAGGDEAEIPRDHVIETIARLLTSFDVVTVEGDQGYGKTTLARQFCHRFHDRSVSLFVSSQSRWAYDPHYARIRLCHSFSTLMGRPFSPAPTVELDATLSALICEAQSKFKRTGIFFVVDGLDEWDVGTSAVTQLLDLLPLGFKPFKFLISWPLNNLTRVFSKSSTKSLPVPTLTPEEGARYLSRHCDEPTAASLFALTRGVPANLMSIVRLLDAGEKAADLLLRGEVKLTELFEREWKLVPISNNDCQLLLAVIAFEDTEFSPATLGEIVEMNSESVIQQLSRFPFLRVSSADEPVMFQSSQFIPFARKQLASFHRLAKERLVDHYLHSTSKSPSPRMFQYLRDLHRSEEVFTLLSPEVFTAAIGQVESTKDLAECAQVGVDIARSEGHEAELFLHVINRSLLRDRISYDAIRAQIVALVKVGDQSRALATAQAIPLKLERLLMLAAFGRACVDAGLPPDETVKDTIKALYSDVEPDELKQHRLALAEDLICVDPDLAVSMIETAGPEATSPESVTRIAQLYVQAQIAELQTPADKPFPLERLRGTISHPSWSEFTEALPLFFRAKSAADVLTEIGRFGLVRTRLITLSSWATIHSNDPALNLVIEAAFDQCIKATEYSPRAVDLYPFFALIDNVSDPANANKLLDYFDVFRNSIISNGPSPAVARLLFCIHRVSSSRGNTRVTLQELLQFIEGIEDSTARAESLSLLLADSHARNLYSSSTELQEARGTFIRLAEELLTATVSHDRLLARILLPLVFSFPDLVADLLARANTAVRRDVARHMLVARIASRIRTEDHVERAVALIGEVHSVLLRASAILALLNSSVPDAMKSDVRLKLCKRLLESVKAIEDNHTKGLCLCRMMDLLDGEVAEVKDLRLSLVPIFEQALSRCETASHRVALAFEGASSTAGWNSEAATKLLSVGNEETANPLLFSEAATEVLVFIAHFVVSAHGAVVERGEVTNEDLEEMKVVVSSVPSEVSQIQLWAAVGEFYLHAGHTSTASKICEEHLAPLLERIKKDRGDYLRGLGFAFRLLFSIHPLAGDRWLDGLNSDDVMAFKASATRFQIQREPLLEPINDREAPKREYSYDDLLGILSTLGRLSDSHVFWVLFTVFQIAERSKKAITKEQRNAIAKRLKEISDNSFPLTTGVQHRGYGILADAVFGVMTAKNDSYYEALRVDTNGIPNIADRVFILAMLASILPTKMREIKTRCTRDALQYADSIPDAPDRAGRLLLVAEHGFGDTQLLREAARKAFSHSCAGDDPHSAAIRRRAVDLVYSWDSDQADKLIDSLDSDEARQKYKAELGDRISINKATRGIKRSEGAKPVSDDSLPDFAWQQLAELNTGRAIALNMTEIIPHLHAASRLGLRKAYPVIMWAIASAREHHVPVQRPKADRVLRGILKSAINAFRVSQAVIRRSAAASNEGITAATRVVNDSGIVMPGSRAEATHSLRKWLRDNVSEWVKICDPYFSETELYFVKWVLECDGACTVDVLTSPKGAGDDGDLPERFRSAWSSICSSAPPETLVVVAATEKGEPLIHDRWILSDKAGVRIGTSLNSLGAKSYSEIVELSETERQERLALVENMLARRYRQHNGSKVTYTFFTLR